MPIKKLDHVLGRQTIQNFSGEVSVIKQPLTCPRRIGQDDNMDLKLIGGEVGSAY
jgi:hypothetical protein